MLDSYSFKTASGISTFKKLGGSALLTLKEAEKYGITAEEIIGTQTIKLTYNGKVNYFRFQDPNATTNIGFQATQDKATGRSFMEYAGISTAKGFALKKHQTEADWLDAFHALAKPLVVKPTHGTQGQSVFMNIQKEDEFIDAVKACFQHSTIRDAGAIVEEMFDGLEYRILATPDKVIGIVHRRPANVVGDGKSTIQQLIDQKNSDPRRGDDPNDVLVKIKVDEHVQKHLASQQITLETIPKIDQRIFLRLNSNISTGGDSIDFTDLAHPSVKDIAIATVRSIPGLAFAGVDFMTKDITQPQSNGTYVIVEVNHTPGYSIHDFPYEGKNRHAAFEFLCLMFPELREKFVD